MSRKLKPSARTNGARRRAQKLLREITKSVNLKKRMKDKLGMTAESAARECGDEIH
jgi:hypothetical protein